MTRAEPVGRTGTDESAVIDAVLAGDEEAFRALYRAHAPALYRAALRLSGGSAATAQDVVQEAWRRALAGLPDFAGRSTLRTWLKAITVRCALERIRWDRRGGESRADIEPDPGPWRDPLPRIDLERAVGDMPAGYRTVLMLHDVEGYRHDEIGELLGISTGTSKSQLSRARAWLRAALGADYGREDTP